MSVVQGIKVKEISFSGLKRVGVLFYDEFPSTLIYADDKNIPFVLEWVDCDDEGVLDRFLLFQTTKKLLTKFLLAEISHVNFIRTSLKEYITYFEGSLEKPLNPVFLRFDEIPDGYLPSNNVFFNKEESVQLQEITANFNISLEDRSVTLFGGGLVKERLKELLVYDSEPSPLELTKLVAEKQLRQVFNIHLQEGKDVDFGVANTSILGNVLTSFDSLYRATALDVFEGVTRGNIVSFNSKKAKALLPKITTEVFLEKAASFSVFIRPVVSNQQLLIDSSTETDVVSDRLFSLFFTSENKEGLESSFNKYSSFVYKSYIEFLTVIKENDLEVDYNFYSPFNKAEYVRSFNSIKAWEVLEIIDQLSNKETEKFNLIVRFTALNCNTGHYYCESGDKQIYSGHFDKLLHEGMPGLNFTDIYEVSVERKITKITGRVDPKIEDTVLSCLKQ